jgi:hypothetical protein
MPLKAETVEQGLLHHPPLAHHRTESPAPNRRESATGAPIKQSVSTQFAHSGRPGADAFETFKATYESASLLDPAYINCANDLV